MKIGDKVRVAADPSIYRAEVTGTVVAIDAYYGVAKVQFGEYEFRRKGRSWTEPAYVTPRVTECTVL